MRTLRRKVLAVFMAVLLGMASFAVLAEEPLESENAETIEIDESVSSGNSVIYDKSSETTDDVENEDMVEGGESTDAIETDDVVDTNTDDMEDMEEELEKLAEDQGIVYADDDIASGVDGDITWVIDASGKLTVNGTGDLSGDRGYYSENFAWSRYKDQITSAEINVRGMTDASCLFSGCSNMVSVDLSNFDTSNVTEMGGMFEMCSNLSSLDVSGFDTSNVTDMSGMFSRCSNLTNLDVSGFDTSNVMGMEYMFAMCSGLTSLDVSSFDTSSVTGMESMFWDCSGLTSLDVSGFDTSNVTSITGMRAMFAECSGLTNLDVSGFDTSNVTNMDSMFYGCYGLTSLDVSGFDTSNVETMAEMFAWCSGLTSLDVSGFDTGRVTHFENTGGMIDMFAHCSSLTSLDVSGFDTSNVMYMMGMFSGCSGLTSLDVSNFDTSSVIDMRDMFSECDNITTINSPYNVAATAILPSVPGTTWHLPDGTKVTKLPQGLGYSVTLIRSGEPTTPKITTTTDDLNMADIIRVKYVPYSYTVATDNTDAENTITFSIVEGTLAEGLQISPTTGEIYGVPMEAGEFKVTVMATYSKPEYPPSYAELILIILDNTDDNVGGATDLGYNITQPVADFNMDTTSGDGTQTLVSQGEYAQFQHIVYIDGKLLEEGEGKDYTSEAGSTRITIRNQTLADSGVGTHTLCIVFRAEDGTLKRAAQNYTVSSGSSGDDGGNDKPGDEGNGDKNPGNQNTDAKPPVDNSPSNSGNNSNISNSSKGDTTSIELVKNTVDIGNVTEVTYTIVSGDTLWKIADRFYGNGSLWTKIFADNADIIKDANKIYVGQVIRLYIMDQPEQASISVVPTTTSIPLGNTGQLPIDAEIGEVYVVHTGDSLWKIAAKLYGDGHKWRNIYAANQDVLRAPGKIYAGQRLIIPDK